MLEMARLVERVSARYSGVAQRPHRERRRHRTAARARMLWRPTPARAEVDVRIVACLRRSLRIDKLPSARFALHRPRLHTGTLSGGINRPPMERKPGTVTAVQAGPQKLAAEMGFVLEEAATGGGSDGNFTAALGIPTLDGMGAIGTGAHAPHEHIDPTHLAPRTALLAAMLSASELAAG